METQFSIGGMTCSSCAKKVSELLSDIEGVHSVTVQLDKKTALLQSDREITEAQVIHSLKNHPKYIVGTKRTTSGGLQKKSFLQTYLPVLLIGSYLILVCTFVEIKAASFSMMQWMNHFMAGFFLVFSFFKLLNLKGFAAAYAMYDVVALKWKTWGYLYPFVEFLLGVAFLTGILPLLSNLVAFFVMSVGLIGVLQSVVNKRKIKCACLGDVFNLPMSTVTVIENSLMMLMSGVMIADYLFS
jgi:copper chaperone CopZ